MVLQYVLALHIGAGRHSIHQESQYTDLMNSTLQECRQQIDTFKANYDKEIYSSARTTNSPTHATKSDNGTTPPTTLDSFSTKITARCIALLENSPITNAGLGSNLTRAPNSHVTCDACLMNSSGQFASVGALRGVKNPIEAVRYLMERKFEGFVEPVMMSGLGVWEMLRQERGLKNGSTNQNQQQKDSPLNEVNEETILGLEEELPTEPTAAASSASSEDLLEICESESELDSYLVHESCLNRWNNLKERLYDTVGATWMVWDDGKRPPSRISTSSSSARKADPFTISSEISYSNENSSQDHHALEASSRYNRATKRRKTNPRRPSTTQKTSFHNNKQNHDRNTKKSTVSPPTLTPVKQIHSAAGVSSGGILWKHAGRIGEAAIAGTGTYADSDCAVSCTGCGEDIMLSFTAQRLARQVKDLQQKYSNDEECSFVTPSHEAFRLSMLKHYVSRRDFQHQDALDVEHTQPRNLIGAIMLSRESSTPAKSDSAQHPHSNTNNITNGSTKTTQTDESLSPRIRLSLGFTTWSMGVAYMSSFDSDVHSSIERIDSEANVGKEICFQEICIR